MAGTVKKTDLNTRTARAKLKSKLKDGRVVRWSDLNLTVGGITKAHLGYQRWPEDKIGRWVLRTYKAGKYTIQPLGKADDIKDGDGLSSEAAVEMVREQLAAPAKKNKKLTVWQAMLDYIAEKERQNQPTKDLMSRSRAHIKDAPIGNYLVSELTADVIRSWHAGLAQKRAMVRSSEGDQRYKPAPTDDEGVRRRRNSANRVMAMLKGALNFAYDEGRVASREQWGRKVKPFKKASVSRARYLSVNEAQRLINASDPDFRLLVMGALQTGCRYGELCRLTVADYNPDTDKVTIRRSKTGKVRHVVLTDEGAAFFKQVTAGKTGSALIFNRADSGWKASDQAFRIKIACERAKIEPPITFHGLRHTWASRAVMNGMPLMVVARNLGHKDTKMVEHHYGHMDDDFFTKAVREHAPRFGVEPDERVVALRSKSGR
jgi:integrase